MSSLSELPTGIVYCFELTLHAGMMKPCKLTWSKSVIKVANLSSYRTLRAKTLPWWLACLSVFYLIRKYNKTPASAHHTCGHKHQFHSHWICWERHTEEEERGYLPSCTKEIENCLFFCLFFLTAEPQYAMVGCGVCAQTNRRFPISGLSRTDLPQAQLIARMLTAFL